MQATIEWGNKRIERTVFKDRMFKKPIENAIEGDTGYVVIDYAERVVRFDEKSRRWKVVGSARGYKGKDAHLAAH